MNIAWRFGCASCCTLALASSHISAASSGAEQDARQPGSGYLVIGAGLNDADQEHAKFATLADEIARFHHGETLSFDGSNFEALGATLRQWQPRNVLVVIPPEALDVTFHRRFFRLISTMDDDIFADFAFGYFTARDGAALRRLWEQTQRLRSNGLPHKRWIETNVTSGPAKSGIDGRDHLSSFVRDAGFDGENLRWATSESDPEVLKFVDQNLKRLEGAGVIAMWGNGDPQGIWLFDDHRNVDKSKHWPFDPAKVGHDADGAMPRIKADRFRTLDLGGAIVWSGTCHSAATHRVLVEADIVSTFGASDRIEEYRLAADESMCLSLLDAGAGAVLAPIASNHGYSAICEAWFALGEGASLGEILKFTYDDVLLQSNGKPALHLAQPGQRAIYGQEQPMQAGAVNRILIGDPSLRPFSSTDISGERVTVAKASDDAFTATVEWDGQFHPMAWNIYGGSAMRMDGAGGRIFARIDLADWLPADQSVHHVSVRVTAGDDETDIPCKTRWAVDDYQGHRYVFLQAEGDQQRFAAGALKAVFTVSPKPAPAVAADDAGRKPEDQLTAAQLLSLGLSVFQTRDQQHMGWERAADMLQRAADHRDSTPDQQDLALFYLAAAQSNLGHQEQQVATLNRWFTLFPRSERRDYALFMKAEALLHLGDASQARSVLQALIREFPQSPSAERARALLESDGATDA